MTLWISIYLPGQPDPLPLQADASSAGTGSSPPLQRIALAMLQYTPELSIFDSQSLVLDTGASLSLFKGPRALYKHIQTTLKHMHLQARIGMAPTALGAWLLARQTQARRRRVLRMHAMERLLNNLPVCYLPASHPFLDWLSDLGCMTLHDLRQLPRTGLAQRTSPALCQSLDAAYGKSPMQFQWFQPPEVFQARHELDFHTCSTQAILAVAHQLIQQLCGWLQARLWATSSLELALHHEKGRHARPATRVSLHLSDPAWRTDEFLAVLTEQLGRQSLPASVIAVELHNVHGQPRSNQPDSFFPDPTTLRRHENELLDLLRARLGQRHVLQPRAIANHLPDQAERWTPAQPGSSAARTLSCGPFRPAAAARPFWLFEHARELTTIQDRPCYQGRQLRLLHGPERLESNWWESGHPVQRDYFIASDTSRCCYWIYCERGTPNPRWFLHGLFA